MLNLTQLNTHDAVLHIRPNVSTPYTCDCCSSYEEFLCCVNVYDNCEHDQCQLERVNQLSVSMAFKQYMFVVCRP